jgi:hypothetical protein
MDIARLEQLRDELLRNRKALIALVASAVLMMLFSVGMLVGGYHLVKRSMEDARVTTRSSNVPTLVGALLSDQRPGEVLNHIVFFNDVRLESGPADNVYYAVDTQGKRVLVVALGSKSATGEDALVDVSGTVRSLPPTSEMRKKWKLDKDEIQAVRDQGIFIEADSIQAKKQSNTRVAKK